jgi:flagellar biosynthetic protein FliO
MPPQAPRKSARAQAAPKPAPIQAAPTSTPAEAPDAPTTGQTAPTRPAAPDWAALADTLRGINWREPRTAWQQLVERFGLTKLLVACGALLLGLLLILTTFVLPGGTSGDPLDSPGAGMELILKLGAVLALVYVSMAALKRYTSGSVSQRGTLLEVLDSTTLGPNRSVYVVRAGAKRLVLGVTQNQITALAELDADDATVTLEAEAGAPPAVSD